MQIRLLHIEPDVQVQVLLCGVLQVSHQKPDPVPAVASHHSIRYQCILSAVQLKSILSVNASFCVESLWYTYVCFLTAPAAKATLAPLAKALTRRQNAGTTLYHDSSRVPYPSFSRAERK